MINRREEKEFAKRLNFKRFYAISAIPLLLVSLLITYESVAIRYGNSESAILGGFPFHFATWANHQTDVPIYDSRAFLFSTFFWFLTLLSGILLFRIFNWKWWVAIGIVVWFIGGMFMQFNIETSDSGEAGFPIPHIDRYSFYPTEKVEAAPLYVEEILNHVFWSALTTISAGIFTTLILEMLNNPSTQRIIYPLAPLVCCVMSLVYKTASHAPVNIFGWKARGWPLPYLVHFPYHEEELAFLSAIISMILFCLNYLIWFVGFCICVFIASMLSEELRER